MIAKTVKFITATALIAGLFFNLTGTAFGKPAQKPAVTWYLTGTFSPFHEPFVARVTIDRRHNDHNRHPRIGRYPIHEFVFTSKKHYIVSRSGAIEIFDNMYGNKRVDAITLSVGKSIRRESKGGMNFFFYAMTCAGIRPGQCRPFTNDKIPATPPGAPWVGKIAERSIYDFFRVHRVSRFTEKPVALLRKPKVPPPPANLFPKVTKLSKGKIIAPSALVPHATANNYSFWMNPVAPVNAWTSIMFKGPKDTERGPGIYFMPNSTRLHVRVSTEKFWNEGCDAKANLPLRKWSHVFVQLVPGSMQIYINGKRNVACKIGRQLKKNSGPLYASNPWYIPANALIGHVVKYNTAQTPAQIAAIAKKVPAKLPVVKAPPPPPPLVKLFSSVTKLSKKKVIAPSSRVPHSTVNSYSFWMSPAARVNAWTSILFKGPKDTERGPGIYFMPKTTRLHVRVSTEKFWNEGCDAKANLPLRKWSHVFVQLVPGSMQLYINGKRDVACKIGRQLNKNNGPLYASSPWYQPANGLIGHVVKYNTAQTPAQIAAIAKKVPAKLPPVNAPSSPVLIGKGLVCLKTHSNRHYVVAEKNKRTVNANRRHCKDWERLLLTDLNGGNLLHGDKVSLRTHWRRYWTAMPDGRLVAKVMRVNAWEKFTIHKVSGYGGRRILYGNKIALKGAHGKFVVAEGGGGKNMKANRPRAQQWETFTLVKP